VPADNNATGLGFWTGADLGGTARLFAGDGADDDLPPVSRFGRNVARLALRRTRQHLGDMRRDAIAVFLLQPGGLSGTDTTRQPMLGDGGVEISGRIWFVPMNVQSGRELVPPSEGAGEVFDYIQGLGLGDVPAAVFNPTVTTPTVRLYRHGLNDEESVETVDIVDRETTLDDIKRVIDAAHESNLCTPDAQVAGVSMWHDADKHRAAQNAEAIAQAHVKTALSVALFSCDVRHEQPMKVGRVDLEVVQRMADGSSIIPAEIEIKVLRERNIRGHHWSATKNEKWMRRGARQAAAYRDERRARAGMLCCFDMRATDVGDTAAFAAVKAYADGLSVELHRNYLFNDAERYRVARYGP
jgi:hypothetical protein